MKLSGSWILVNLEELVNQLRTCCNWVVCCLFWRQSLTMLPSLALKSWTQFILLPWPPEYFGLHPHAIASSLERTPTSHPSCSYQVPPPAPNGTNKQDKIKRTPSNIQGTKVDINHSSKQLLPYG